jgi:LysM repeat protein
MVKLLKALVILALLGAIGAGLAAAYYYLVEQPKKIDAMDLLASASGQPTPDPGKADFERAQSLKHDRKYDEAKIALESFLTHYPDSPHKTEVESMLGDINLGELFSGKPGPGKLEYIVLPGDVLDRVARKTKSNPELIFQSNSLERTMLRIGQKLEVPQVDFSIEVHLTEGRLYLLNNKRFFKAYEILSAKPPGKKIAEIHTKISEKRAYKDGKLVAFGGKDYLGSARSLALDKQPAFTITGEIEVPVPDKPVAPSGILLASSDVEELHTLVNIGTPVTISPD